MNYKIVSGDPLFISLSQLYIRIKDAEKAAEALAAQYGANGYASEYKAMAGGIMAFHFEEAPKTCFKRLLTNTGKWYKLDFSQVKRMISRIAVNPQGSVTSIAITDINLSEKIVLIIDYEIAQLPVVYWKEFHDLIGYNETLTASPGGEVFVENVFRISWGIEYILVRSATEIDYLPVPGMRKISDREFKRLEAAIK